MRLTQEQQDFIIVMLGISFIILLFGGLCFLGTILK